MAVTPVPTVLGNGTVIAPGVVAWRGAEFLTDTTGFVDGQVIPLILGGSVLRTTSAKSGAGPRGPRTSYTKGPPDGAYVTGDIWYDTTNVTELNQVDWLNPANWSLLGFGYDQDGSVTGYPSNQLRVTKNTNTPGQTLFAGMNGTVQATAGQPLIIAMSVPFVGELFTGKIGFAYLWTGTDGIRDVTISGQPFQTWINWTPQQTQGVTPGIEMGPDATYATIDNVQVFAADDPGLVPWLWNGWEWQPLNTSPPSARTESGRTTVATDAAGNFTVTHSLYGANVAVANVLVGASGNAAALGVGIRSVTSTTMVGRAFTPAGTPFVGGVTLFWTVAIAGVAPTADLPTE